MSSDHEIQAVSSLHVVWVLLARRLDVAAVELVLKNVPGVLLALLGGVGVASAKVNSCPQISRGNIRRALT